MSLITSIFGGAPDSANSKEKKVDKNAAPDLFGTKLSVPTILHKKKSTPLKKGNKQTKKDDSADKTKDNAGSSSTATGSEDAQPTPGDDAQTKNSTATKKTKEQLKEEEERTIFVGNLPPDTSRRALAGIFKPCGKVESARLRSMAVAGVKLPPDQAGNQSMMKKVCANTGKFLAGTSKKSAQGYVVFGSTESIESALKLNNTTYESHTIRVDQAAPTIEPTRSVFVGNLPYKADEETLRTHFLDKLSDGEDLNESEGSAISGVRIIRDKETQQCKGFGYVTLRDATLVPAALQLHGSTYMKREMRVMVCGKRTKGNRGGNDSSNTSGRRSFEGQRATGPPSTKNPKNQPALKRKADEVKFATGAKRRRARSEKKTTISGAKSGMSKRATVEKKVNKKVKKLEKRAKKGMGKK